MARNSDEETLGQGREEDHHQHGDGNGIGIRNDNQKLDGAEKGEKKPEEQGPVGFFHPSMKSTRNGVIKSWAITTLILATVIMAVLSLYWGVLFRVEQNLTALVVWIVDFDGQVTPYTNVTPMVGPQIVQAAKSLIAPVGALGWGSVPASQFNYDPIEVRRQVYDNKAWAAIVINANATALLQSAVQNGNASYDPMGAAQVVYVQARDETTHSNYVTPQLTMFQQQVTSMFGKIWAEQILSQASSNPTILSNIQSAPQAINPGIGFSTFNLRPFNPPVETPAITIGLIYLIIIAFFSFTFYLPHHMKLISSPGQRPLKFPQYVIWRWLAAITAYLLLSLAYSLISLGFQISFSAEPGSHTDVASPADKYHRASFVVYWMVDWVG